MRDKFRNFFYQIFLLFCHIISHVRTVFFSVIYVTFSIFSGSGRYPSETGQAGQRTETWTCDHCTFINGGNLNICEMCGLPM